MPAFDARLFARRLYLLFGALLLSTLFFEVMPAVAQSELATVFGRVTDPSGAVIGGAEVEVRNVDTGILVTSATNADGLYTVPSLHPGHYVISVRKPGFRSVSATGLELNVQDNVARNFSLQVGSASESVTVSAESDKINTTDASVSTVVDRQFAENLPMNGRSFQTLIQLTPGVVLTQSNNNDNGQFSVNGQRAASNYWMVDGVSANIGIGTSNFVLGNGLAGAVGAFSIQGGTNSLVSVDALQEFRIQTSTFAPEFGRTPGAQISISTRSGTNEFHGTLFDYFRNDAFDANDWFANENNLSKPEERQNDFGGTFSGPIIPERTFFFFSYEGLRLRLPQVAQSLVPDVGVRQNAAPAIQPILNTYALPNGPDDVASGIAEFNASFSNSSSLDAYSLRVDHRLTQNLNLFGRFNYSPSKLISRGILNSSLDSVIPAKILTSTLTVGSTWSISSAAVNDLRLNYSRTNGSSFAFLDNLGGGVPLASLPFPAPFDGKNGQLDFIAIPFGPFYGPFVGPQGNNTQRQFNVVENISLQKGLHSLKFGVDFRRLSPSYGNPAYAQLSQFFDVSSLESGSGGFVGVTSSRNGSFVFRNLGLFAQDTWRVLPRLTPTYGLRGDVGFHPSSAPNLLALTSFDLNNLTNVGVAPPGTPAFQTRLHNLAPRIGIAYQMHESQKWQTVLRGGAGIFFDLATQEVGNLISSSSYPFGATNNFFPSQFPLDPVSAEPPVISAASIQQPGDVVMVFDPQLNLPYTLQWSMAIEQALGLHQSISASYIGSAGRRLIQTALIEHPNSNLSALQVALNSAVSDYDALQVQFHRNLARGLQGLTSYTWAHSIDTASAGSLFGNEANGVLPGHNEENRGPSDFDIRNAFSAGVTYEVPFFQTHSLLNAVAHGWSLQNVIQARSALPVNVADSNFFSGFNGIVLAVRPDVVPGQPFYLSGPGFPGGKGFNPAAFSDPPTTPAGCSPLFDFPCNPARQGDLGRNALRGFGAFQWDLAVHRDFLIHESLKLQFRAELFNVLNHPNFAPPVSDIANTTQFGRSTQMLGKSLAGGNVGSGGLSPLYQLGGPRSVQLALKLQF